MIEFEDEDPFIRRDYLKRLQINESLDLTKLNEYELLDLIVHNHAKSIPFENQSIMNPKFKFVDPIASPKYLISLKPKDIFHKLVKKSRGGFCFENNLLLARALRDFGFLVFQVGARCVNQKVPTTINGLPFGALTHLILLVTLSDGRTFLVDNGFTPGSGATAHPLELLPEKETVDSVTGEVYRFVQGSFMEFGKSIAWGSHFWMSGEKEIKNTDPSNVNEWFLQYKNVREAVSWWDVYHFDRNTKMSRMDCELGCWYASTNPDHSWTKAKVAAILTDEGKNVLYGNKLTIRKRGVVIEEREVEEGEDYEKVLKEYFNIFLDV